MMIQMMMMSFTSINPALLKLNIYIRMIYKNHTHLLTSGSDILSREGRDVPPRIFSKTEKIRSEKKLMLAAFKNVKISP